MSRQTCTVQTLGCFGDETFLQHRVNACLDHHHCDESVDAVLTGDIKPFPKAFQKIHDSRIADLDGMVGMLEVEFHSMIVPYVKAKVILPAHRARQWATQFTTGAQWAFAKARRAPL